MLWLTYYKSQQVNTAVDGLAGELVKGMRPRLPCGRKRLQPSRQYICINMPTIPRNKAVFIMVNR